MGKPKEVSWPKNILNAIKVIESLYDCCKAGNETAISTIMETEDLEDLCYMIVDDACHSGVTEDDELQHMIDVLNYIEDEMGISSTVSDTVYDIAMELLNDVDMGSMGACEEMDTASDTREHSYPELRGSLQKVHYPNTDDIPKGDTRKSLEDFLKNTLEKFLDDNPDEVVDILPDFKWDGSSNIFECTGTQINHVLTRYKVKANLGKDITHIYKNKTVEDIFGSHIPIEFYKMGDYGVKTEVIMRQDKFEGYKKYMTDRRCNRRSAVSSILNRSADNFSPEMLYFLEVVPLQISTSSPIPGDPDIIQLDDDFVWYRMGEIDGRMQYISNYCCYNNSSTSVSRFRLTKESISSYYGENCYRELARNLCNNNIPLIMQSASQLEVPIDGIVFTFVNKKLVQLLGRSNDKNNFQVAFKFPAGVAKTTLFDVEFQVGPIAGTITPVAIIEPVHINGSRISHIGLSNMEKLERLDLHKGDEILVQHDIIPKIMVDSTCKKGNGEKILPVTNCPICGESIKKGRCVNPECESKLIGRISNYVTKMNIPGFGIETITTLVSRGILESITDLYKLSQIQTDLLSIPGFQEKTVTKLVSAPLNRLHIYPHELFGSIGIPDVSLATMEKLCRVIDTDVLVNQPETLLSLYSEIKGIGKTTAIKIVDGINQRKDLIKGLLPYFSFKSYGNVIGNVVFTGIRDPEFSQFLQDNPGIRTSSSVTKDTIAVITKDDQGDATGTMKDAEKKGIPIIAITDAKNKWGYTKP